MKKSFKILVILIFLIVILINIYNFNSEKYYSIDENIKKTVEKNMRNVHPHKKEDHENYHVKHTHKHLDDINKKINQKSKIDNIQYNIITEELKRRKIGLTGPKGEQGLPGKNGEQGQSGESIKYTILNDTWTVDKGKIENFNFNFKNYKELVNGKFWTEEPCYVELENNKDNRSNTILSVIIFDENSSIPQNCSGLYKLNIMGLNKSLFIEYEKNFANVEAEINLDCVSGELKINTWPSDKKTYRVIIEGKILF